MRQKSGKFFEVVVAYEKINEDGLTKNVRETVVAEAFTCGEAENRALEETASMSYGEVDCQKVGIAPYKEIFFADDGDIFYKTRVSLITFDEVSGKEKRTNVYHLTNANTIEAARKNIVEAYNGTTIDYVIASISETKITEVYEKK